MIGTGPSTAQVAPKIQPIVKKLILFQRSPTFVLPRRDEPISPRMIWIFTWIPFALQFYHLYLYFKKESSKPNQYSGTPEQQATAAVALRHLHNQVKDPVLRAKLTPNHEFGCKRPLVLDDYYPTLEKPNVELIINKPVRITEDSIISDPPSLLPKQVLENEPEGAYDVDSITDDHKELESKIDVLIWGTGTSVFVITLIRRF
jgi:cation diffusion facilitator CzcD-associated flavoprotein CzcO